MKIEAISVVLLALLFLSLLKTVSASSATKCVIYGRGCFSCFRDYANRLMTALNEINITDIQPNYLEGNPQASEDLDQLRKQLGVPESMKGSITVVFDGKFLFEGYISEEIIIDFLTNHMKDFTKIVVYRDELRGLYRIIDENGEIIECKIDISISECVGKSSVVHAPLTSILLLVVVSGIMDGINPCAFAVLMFFVAFLFLAGRSVPIEYTRRRVLIVGLIYVTAVFLSYLLIGLAMIKVIETTSFPHLVAEIGALIVILLGIINIKDYFFYGRLLSLRISTSNWRRIGKWIHKATIPSAVITGFMVSLFEFPCTGGIYVAILGLLAVRTTFIEGFFFLVIYNLAFVLPLLIILFLSSNEKVIERMRERQERDKKLIRLFLGLIMVTLGLFLLFVRYV